MKHSRISLLEKAAELYDFGAALRAPAPVNGSEEEVRPEPKPAPVETGPVRSRPASTESTDEAAPDPLPIWLEPAAPAERSTVPEPDPETVREARTAPKRPRARDWRTATIDRERLLHAGYLVPEAPVTGLAEEFRLIKRQLLAAIERRISQPIEKRRTILVTSAQSGDGKSFCSVNLALSLAAESGLEVLLVDGDFAKPDALRLLGIDSGPGLVDALADPTLDPESLVVRTDVPGLSVLPAGRKVPNVPELLASERTREILACLVAGDNRIIVFDSPPALMASPAAIMAAQVGQVLVVVRADRTTEADLRETINLLSGCDHVSLVLNAAALADSGRNFGGYEGYRHED